MDKNIPKELTKSINALAKMPGVGRVSAKRAVLHMLQDKSMLAKLIETLHSLNDNIQTCEICGNVSDNEICNICSDTERTSSIICVVEGVSQLWAMESSESFKGKYFVLNGLLNALEGKGMAEVGINKLTEMVKTNSEVNEVILAVSASVDGLTTSHVMAENLEKIKPNLKITSLAKGIPIGAGLDYMDSGTLFLALKNRNIID
ncbi:MAG: recombination protein RecR [Proteobacteria bacterium]|nr:recombination protein RecR [Pseudomonadota bacterium]